MKEEIQMDMVQIAQKLLTNPTFLDNSTLLVDELKKLYEKALLFHFLEKNHPELLRKTPTSIHQEPAPSYQEPTPSTKQNDWEDIRSHAPENEVVFEEKNSHAKIHTEAPKTLNDRISSKELQIGLNDRIAFVTHLFDGDTQAYNKAIAMINNLHSPDECWEFIFQKIKPSYNNWQGKEAYEDRFFYIISKHFG